MTGNGPSSSAIGGITHSTTTVTVAVSVNESSASLIVYSNVAVYCDCPSNSLLHKSGSGVYSIPSHPSFLVAVPLSGVPTLMIESTVNSSPSGSLSLSNTSTQIGVFSSVVSSSSFAFGSIH